MEIGMRNDLMNNTEKRERKRTKIEQPPHITTREGNTTQQMGIISLDDDETIMASLVSFLSSQSSHSSAPQPVAEEERRSGGQNQKQQQQKDIVVTRRRTTTYEETPTSSAFFFPIVHGAKNTNKQQITTTTFTSSSCLRPPSKTYSVAQMFFIFLLTTFLFPLQNQNSRSPISLVLSVSAEAAQDQGSNTDQTNPAPSAAAQMGPVTHCEPYSKQLQLHTEQDECAGEDDLVVDKEMKLLIRRPRRQHNCETCAKTVAALEASHYLALELTTVVVQDHEGKEDVQMFLKCHTCLCGVLAIYDGPYLLGEWCYGRFTSKYLTSTSRSLSFVYKPDSDATNPNASFSLTVKPVPVTHTEIIEVGSFEGQGVVSGSITSAGFPRRSYDKFADGYQLWIFVNKRPNTTMRLQVNDIFIKPPEMVGFCQDPINIFHGPPQVSNTWFRFLCSRNYPEDFYFHSPIVSVQFTPNFYGSISEYANGFNMSYTFFDRNVTSHKNLDCGEFNNSARAYGQGFTLPPGMNKPFGVAGSSGANAAAAANAAKANSDIINSGASKASGASSSSGSGATESGSASGGGAGSAAKSGDVDSPSPNPVHPNYNDLRCHWRVSGVNLAEGYSRYIVTVTNFTVKPATSNDEATKHGHGSEGSGGSDNSKWSVVLKESAGLKLYDGIYSTSPLLTAHSAMDHIQPGNKAAFYLSSGREIRIDVSYPTLTRGTIGFAYAAISPVNENDPEHPCDKYTEFLCDTVSPHRPHVAGEGGEQLGRYCIRRELMCDGFVNCVEGDDEDPYGRSQCANRTYISAPDKPEYLPPLPRFGQGLSSTLIICLVVAVAVVILGTVTIVLITRKLGGNNNRSGGGRRRSSSHRGLSHRNPALDDNSSAPGGRSSSVGYDSGAEGGNGPGTGGSRSGRSSRHNSGESSSGGNGGRNDAVFTNGGPGAGMVPGAAGAFGNGVAPQIVEHDPHVAPQPLFIAKMPSQQPPLYDLVCPKRLPSVDEEAELGANGNSNHSTLSEDDRTYLLGQSSSSKHNDHSII